jgi:hypothetical protein
VLAFAQMDLPTVVHPKRFLINGYLVEVLAYRRLSDDEAAQQAAVGFPKKYQRKKGRGELLRVLSLLGLND